VSGHIKNILGQRFGNFTVINFVRLDRGGAIWLVQCVCGNKVERLASLFTRVKNAVTHCGCKTSKNRSNKGSKNANYIHGRSKTKEYSNEGCHKRRIKLKNSNRSITFYTESFKINKPKIDYCVYCGSTDSLSTDHIIPISKGGNQDIKNLVTACKSCNASKNALFFIDWYLKTNRCKRSLDDILKDMGFDSLVHLQNYQDYLCPEHITKNKNRVFNLQYYATKRNIILLDRYYQSLDHYPTH